MHDIRYKPSRYLKTFTHRLIRLQRERSVGTTRARALSLSVDDVIGMMMNRRHRHRRSFSILLLVALVFFFAVSFLFLRSRVSTIDESEQCKHVEKLRNFYGVRAFKVEDRSSLEVEMTKRRSAVNRVCRRLESTRHLKPFSVDELHHVIVDDTNEILFCFVPKVASTNWKRIFLVLMNKNASLNPMDISANATHKSQHFHYLSEYSEPSVRHRLQNYVKFLFVRHPFERLLSAFRNKFENVYNDYFQSRFGRLIIQRHRLNATNESLDAGDDVTFDEFVRYLVDPQTRLDGPLNEHWQSINDLCVPCHVQYDLIGKYEGLSAEAQRILDIVGIGHLVKFPQINRTVDTLLLLDDYFKNVTRDDLFRLYQMYALDFNMFGYKYGGYESSYSPPPPPQHDSSESD